MLEVVFNKSASNSIAQSRYRLETISSEQSTILCFEIGLSMGNISQDLFWDSRRSIMLQRWKPDSSSFSRINECNEYVDTLIKDAMEGLETLVRCIRKGEAVRFWYSDEPDEMCGLFWLSSKIVELNTASVPMSEVKLRKYTTASDIRICSWGEAPPNQWQLFLSWEEAVPPSALTVRADAWKELQKENAGLRAVLNGNLISVPITLYNCIIDSVIAKAESEFLESNIIAYIQEHYQLGISNSMISGYIDELTERGELTVRNQESENNVRFHRVLCKRRSKE